MTKKITTNRGSKVIHKNFGIKLVHSTSDSEIARKGYDQYKLENATQTHFFDCEKRNIFVFATETANCRHFMMTIEKINPSIIIETYGNLRNYGIFKSNFEAESKFKDIGISFYHIPIQYQEDKEIRNSQRVCKYVPISKFKECIYKNYDCFTNKPILVLTSTEYHCNIISKMLQDYCEINLPGAEIEILENIFTYNRLDATVKPNATINPKTTTSPNAPLKLIATMKSV